MGWTSQRAQGGGWRLPTVPYIVISALRTPFTLPGVPLPLNRK